MLYLSGQIGLDAAGKLVPGGIADETRQTMDNIKAVLERHGSSLDKVVKATVMLTDMADWPQMNEVYASYFKEHFPPAARWVRTTLRWARRSKSSALRSSSTCAWNRVCA